MFWSRSRYVLMQQFVKSVFKFLQYIHMTFCSFAFSPSLSLCSPVRFRTSWVEHDYLLFINLILLQLSITEDPDNLEWSVTIKKLTESDSGLLYCDVVLDNAIMFADEGIRSTVNLTVLPGMLILPQLTVLTKALFGLFTFQVKSNALCKYE